ncbi:MAG: AAA family ATPase [Nitrospira sp.]|nr:AAA family ATPase [Nitrospira sp.]
MSKHFFKTLKIERFRGIQSLEMGGLERVNLFVGKNNCGKTSVLEAAFLLSNISNPDLLIGMQNIRGVVVEDSSALRDFFYQRNHEKGIELTVSQVEGRRKLRITPLYGNLQAGQVSGGPSTIPGNSGTMCVPHFAETSIPGQSLTGIHYDFVVRDKASKHGNYEATTRWTKPGNNEFTSSFDSQYKETMPSCYMARQGYNQAFVDSMLHAKRKDLLLRTLQSVDPNVADIRTNSQGLVSVDTGLDSFVPINLLGDGIMRILNILSTIEYVSNGILFIDEIERGLHVTALERVWEVILDRSEKANVQIFLITHSADVVESLRNVLDGKLSSDSVACYRLVKFEEDDATHAFRYSSKQLRLALDSHTDIRF